MVKDESYVSMMLHHLLTFLKRCGTFICIAIIYQIVCFLAGITFSIIYNLVIVLVLSGLWCKLRRYRIKDKVKLSYIYTMIILSCVLQVCILNGVFAHLSNALETIGGNT